MTAQAEFESEHIAPYLAFRRRGTQDWVVIDPGTERGRRLAASFGFHPHPTKENIAMSAIPAEAATVHPHLTVVQSNTEKMGLLLAIRTKARQAFDYMLSLPKAAWAWAKETFHLQAVADFTSDGWAWAKAKAATAAHYLGAAGGAGLGLLAMSTEFGRKMIALALKPLVWVGSLFAKGYTKVEDVLHVEEPKTTLDKARTWVSERMTDLRTWAFGIEGVENSFGVVGGAFVKAMIKVAPFVSIDSPAMQTARAAGTGLLGWKLISLLPLLPFGGPMLIAVAQWLLSGLVVLTVGTQILPVAKTGYARGKAVFVKKAIDVENAAAEVVDTAAASETVTQMPARKTTDANRASRRAQQRAAAKAATAKV